MNGDDIKLPAPLPAEVRRRVIWGRRLTAVLTSPRVSQSDKDRLHRCFLSAIAEFPDPLVNPPTHDACRRVWREIKGILHSIVLLPPARGRGE